MSILFPSKRWRALRIPVIVPALLVVYLLFQIHLHLALLRDISADEALLRKMQQSGASQPQQSLHGHDGSHRRESPRRQERAQIRNKALVVATTESEDVSWLRNNFPMLGWSVEAYVVDNDDARLRVPVNKGNEAMVYLTYVRSSEQIRGDSNRLWD